MENIVFVTGVPAHLTEEQLGFRLRLLGRFDSYKVFNTPLGVVLRIKTGSREDARFIAHRVNSSKYGEMQAFDIVTNEGQVLEDFFNQHRPAHAPAPSFQASPYA